MKQTPSLLSFVFSVLVLALLATGLSTTSALAQAQDDQEYKRAYNAGLEAYKAKDIDTAYSEWVRAAQLAQQAGDSEVVRKANNYVAQLDYMRGLQAFKGGDYQQALEHFQKGMDRDPEVATNYYGQGLALRKLDRTDEAIEAFKKALEVAEASRNSKIAREAEERIREHFYFVASSAVSKQGATRSDADRALAALSDLEEQGFELDPDGYYYMAVAYTVKGDYAQAVEMANKALAEHKGSRTDKAKIYFTLGEAHMYAGDTEAAKDAFRNAAYGSYKAPAEHYLETL